LDSSDIGKVLFGRWAILLLIAACAYFLLESQDRLVRLAAFVALVILAQAREWLLFSKLQRQLKDNKH
jgi:hypothetical protein